MVVEGYAAKEFTSGRADDEKGNTGIVVH